MIFAKHRVWNTSITNLIGYFFWPTTEHLLSTWGDFSFPLTVLELLWRTVAAVSFPTTLWNTRFTKILTIRNLIQCVGSVYVLMNLIMLLLMCCLSCPVKSSSRVTPLVKASCSQMVLCWKRSRQSPIKQSPRSKAWAWMLFMLILSCEIVVSASCRNLVSVSPFPTAEAVLNIDCT